MTYPSITAEILEAILAIVDRDRVVSGAISEDYAHDELADVRRLPDVVILPASTREVSAIMRLASQRRIPVTPRGAGTGLVGGAVAVRGGIVLDMSRMNRILELDRDNLTMTVEPGALLMEIAAHAEANGFLYPPDPGEKTATIGGNISTNAGGMRAVKYGVTRDYVRALEVVLPSGDVVVLGGKTVKNSSGYALKDLMVGAEGTLGVITQATLRLIPLPRCVISLLVPFDSLHAAIGTVPALIRRQTTPAAIEFMQREVILDAEEYLGIRFPHTGAAAYLLLRFDGDTPQSIEPAYSQAAEICLEHGAQDVLISDTAEREESLWKARGAFMEAIKASTTLMDEVDVVVQRSHVNALVDYIGTLRAQYGVNIKTFGHAGDGNLHVYLLKDNIPDSEWAGRLHGVMRLIYDKAHSLRGEVSGEHGIGYAKREYLAASKSPALLALMRSVKQSFDPHEIMNPGKICRD